MENRWIGEDVGRDSFPCPFISSLLSSHCGHGISPPLGSHVTSPTHEIDGFSRLASCPTLTATGEERWIGGLER